MTKTLKHPKGIEEDLQENLTKLETELAELEAEQNTGTEDERLARARLIKEIREKRDAVRVNLSALT